MNFNKIYPYLLVVIAIAGLYLNYKIWDDTRKPCSCEEEQFTPIDD